MTWQAWQAGTDVAPTSLDEGRAKMVVPVLLVVFHLILRRRLVNGWGRGGGGTSKGARGQPKCGNVQMRKGG